MILVRRFLAAPLILTYLRAPVAAALAAAVFAGCARRIETGPPIGDSEEMAEAAMRRGPDAPARIRFHWEYSDRRGEVSGEGVARFQPPDSIRLDLFTTGDVAMAAVLVDAALSTSGQIEDVELPPPPFLYAMAGLFRPGGARPIRAFRSDGEAVLVYEGAGDTLRLFRIAGGYVVEVEERAEPGGRMTRRVRVEWPDADSTADTAPAMDPDAGAGAMPASGRGAWPQRAEYRDFTEPSRARWELEEARAVDEPFSRDIYDLGGGGP